MRVIENILDWFYEKKRDLKLSRGRKKIRKRTDLPVKMEVLIKSAIQDSRGFRAGVEHARLWAVGLGFSETEIANALITAVEKLYSEGVIAKKERDLVIR